MHTMVLDTSKTEGKKKEKEKTREQKKFSEIKTC